MLVGEVVGRSVVCVVGVLAGGAPPWDPVTLVLVDREALVLPELLGPAAPSEGVPDLFEVPPTSLPRPATAPAPSSPNAATPPAAAPLMAKLRLSISFSAKRRAWPARWTR